MATGAAALWGRIIDYWRKDCQLGIRPGASDLAISAFERQHKLTLPSDFAEYLRAVDGMDDFESDQELMSFLSLAELRPVHEVLGQAIADSSASPHPRCLVFIDYFIGSHHYAIAVGDDPTLPGAVYRVVDENWHNDLVASSFSQFMTRYAQDPASVV